MTMSQITSAIKLSAQIAPVSVSLNIETKMLTERILSKNLTLVSL